MLATKSEIVNITSGRGFSELQITDSDIQAVEWRYLRDLVLGSRLYNQIVATKTSGKPTAYGYLYNYYALPVLAPSGWRVPTYQDAQDLLSFITATGGGALKSKTTFKYPNTSATDAYGFGALGGGIVNDVPEFFGLGRLASFWINEEVSSKVYCIELTYNDATLAITETEKNTAHSVRFIKEDSGDWYVGQQVTDSDGNVYNTCKVGEQVWTTANYLGITGTSLGDVNDINTSTDELRIAYNSDSSNVGTIPTSAYDTFTAKYIKPVLAWGVFTHILDRIQVEVSDRGMFQLTAQNSQVIGRNEIEAFKASIRENLNAYLEEMRQYVIAQAQAGVVIYSNYYTVDLEEEPKGNKFMVQSNEKKIYHV